MQYELPLELGVSCHCYIVAVVVVMLFGYTVHVL